MRRRFELILILSLSLAGCDSPSTPAPRRAPPVAVPEIERPRIEFAGCRMVEPDGGPCLLAADRDAKLHVWIDVHAEAPLRILVDGQPRALESVAVDGGQRLALALGPQAEHLRIEGLEPRWREPFELTLAREQVPELVDAATRAARSGDPDQIREAIARIEEALDDLDGAARLAALQILRRLLFGSPAALARTEEAAALADSLGRTRDLADCAAAAAYINLDMRNDLVAARRWVARLEQLDGPEARAWAAYYGGLLASRTGDLGGAVQAFARARTQAARIGLFRDFLGASEMHAAVLAELGRGEQALASARETLALGRAPGIGCPDRARLLGNLAWTHLLLAEDGYAHDLPRPLLLEQLELVNAKGECPEPTDAMVARVNLAYVALADAEPEEAHEWLTSLPEEIPSWLRAWVDEARARVGLETGRDELLPDFAHRPRPPTELGLRWTAAVREAQTLERFGVSDAAVNGYLDAERILDEASSTLGIDVGRELFLAGRSASLQGLVELLIARGRVDQALCQIRLARGRELRLIDQAARIVGLSPRDRERRRALLEEYLTLRDQLAAERREDWRFSAPQRVRRERRRHERSEAADALLDEAVRLAGAGVEVSSCDALAPARRGLAMIVPFEAREGAWLFVADHEGVAVTPANTENLAAALASPQLQHKVAGAQRISVLAGGDSWSQSIHALAFGDGVVLDVAPVVYSLDLPVREETDPGQPLAVVVANPSEDLPEAQAEAEAVAAKLAGSGWSVRHHVGGEATRARLSADLAEASVLHYAGHGAYRGPSGWDAALLLSDEDVLGVTDVLALPRVPATIVLTGCETATVSDRTFAGGMNLGRAFVLAGASSVIAADGEVDDALARGVGELLHAELWAGTEATDPGAALRRVLLRLRERDPSAQWQRFRVLVP
ncbi:CHAT domain protein [Enhygromyxa salina]|uniref:CHAT domain protein n=1 Tax=Enhygromyxa salina TaxID=215803 RepID=A0A2S9XG38_9BACT|nr:CHAT domain-containing protein [Enhygromyxa salina]PRP91720.1 CHAT domain protein [Enhygromyxa salina]